MWLAVLIAGWWVSNAIQDLNISVKRLDDRLGAVVKELEEKDGGGKL